MTSRGKADGEPDDVAVAATSPGPGAPPGQRFAAGDQVGRYRVLRRIGAGGMGEVFAAHDVELQRRVAIKVMFPARPGEAAGGERLARLLREAQAMARLSHSNVVTVFEVARAGDDAFVAMEYVEGKTLEEWLRDRSRPWSEVLAAFAQAGRGLAAAHRAGMVHRDFKPSNALVGDDGVVRVTDFGLVGAVDDGGRGVVPLAETTPGGLLDVALTQTGVMLGTPAYMALEQHVGGTVDARSDQFAFCAALHEGLHGQRPFAGDSYAELVANVTAGRVREPPASSAVPARVRRAILRGLSRDAADRFASMDDLLAALAPRPRTGRTRLALAIAGVALGGAGLAVALVLRGSGGGRPSCDGAGDAFAAVWNPEESAGVTAAFQRTGRSYGADTAARVGENLDDYGARWARGWTDACRATRVAGTQSEALLDRRMHCLDRRLGGVRSLVALFREADGATVDGAVAAATRLARIEDCADTDHMLAEVPLPAAADARARVEAERAQLERGKSLRDLGAFERAREAAGHAIVVADRDDYPPLRAEGLLLRGQVEWRLRDAEKAQASFYKALENASLAHDDALTAEIYTGLVFVVGDKLGRYKEALSFQPFAEAAVARDGNRPLARADLLNSLGVVWMMDGQLDRARAAHEEALALRERELGGDASEVSESLEGLGNTLLYAGELGRAAELLERALAINKKLYGPDNPAVGSASNNLANVYASQSRFDEAIELWRRDIGIRTGAYGETAQGLWIPHYNVGQALVMLARSRDALRTLERARTLAEAELGPGHIQMALVLETIGIAQARLGDVDAARSTLERAVAISDAAVGADHADNTTRLVVLAQVEIAAGHLGRARGFIDRTRELEATARTQGKQPTEMGEVEGDLARAEDGCARAIRLYQAARDRLRERHDEDASAAAILELKTGECALELHRTAEAVPHLEASASFFQRSKSDPAEPYVVRATAALARARGAASR